MNNSDGNLLSFITGAAVGALVGAAIGILAAPDKGEKTREKIASKSLELKDDLEAQVEASKDKIEQFANSLLQQLQSLENKNNAAEVEEKKA